MHPKVRCVEDITKEHADAWQAWTTEDDIDEFWIRFFSSRERFVAIIVVDEENADHAEM